ncbi:hypothetical protein [Paractinoplanes durhamensis]|uniref:Uncharacterized protein n=1 Tax=Paractinoplanes durhamensis TaxID=113563 RepID=A0ABQ3Z3H9_9ACTN|nr:hypothetical protein [Actinoplanes durhamensis]GIE04356.1 hypothetical protein Adu01nite_57060 [Actinoplanes durhamensis]
MADPGTTTITMPVYTAAEQFSDVTRGLCSGPYVDVTFANDVIAEVVESERKAVPPSFGFDLDPVVRHCLRARRLLIIRYAVVTALLLAGFILSGWLTVWWLVLCVLIEMLRARRGARARVLRTGVLTLVVLGTTALVLTVVVVLLLAKFTPDWLSERLGTLAVEASTSDLAESFVGAVWGFAALFTLLPIIGMVATLFLSRWHAYSILFSELAPKGRAFAPPATNPRVKRRLETVARMQRGNIAVHDLDPFAGSGELKHGWSFAVTLRPRAAEQNGARVTIDPQELNKRVNDAILALRDTKLSAGERIPNVYTVPYVAADGYRRSDDPLIDPETHTPRTMATGETIAAIESCPQGGLRHYLRVVVPANGKEIKTPDGKLILPAQDSGVSVTAFVHLAVEGGLLYAEFAALVLPPLRADFRIADTLRPDRIVGRAWSDTLRAYVHDNLYGPRYLLRVGWDALRLNGRMARSAADADELLFYDYGARFSVRDLAGRETGKFMQKLDGAKYIKLVDRTVTEAAIGYLREHGVDTSEFESQVSVNTFSGLVFHGGVQNFGGTNTVQQTNNAAPPPRPTPTSGA